jgi:putative ABC transport system permease protein
LDQVDPEQSFFDMETMVARVQASIWQQRVAGVVLALFAGIALCLAVVGTYAVTAEAVASQRAEIAIRLALGSPHSQVVTLVLRQWLVPVAAGVTVGSIAAALGGRVMSTAIAGPGGGTTALMAAVPIVLLLVAVPACYIPVRRTLHRTSLTDVLRAS